MKQVSFTRMDQGTALEFQHLRALEEAERPEIPGHVLGLLQGLAAADSGYRVDRLTHSLQTATRALRDGAEDELVVCALLHDAGDLVAPDNHANLAADLLAPYVSERSEWIVRQHGIFQGHYYFHHIGRDRHGRDAFREHPWYEDCLAFCERWDQRSFDPEYDTFELETFRPLVAHIFAREPWGSFRKSGARTPPRGAGPRGSPY